MVHSVLVEPQFTIEIVEVDFVESKIEQTTRGEEKNRSLPLLYTYKVIGNYLVVTASRPWVRVVHHGSLTLFDLFATAGWRSVVSTPQ